MSVHKRQDRYNAVLDALGGLDYILPLLADGMSLKRIGQKIKKIAEGDNPTKTEESSGSRWAFYLWLKSDPTGERKRQYEEARRVGAGALVDSATKILDDLAKPIKTKDATGKTITIPRALDMPTVTLSRHRASQLMMLAAFHDRDTYGEKAPVAINVSINTLHLDALRAKGMPQNSAVGQVFEVKTTRVLDVPDDLTDSDPIE